MKAGGAAATVSEGGGGCGGRAGGQRCGSSRRRRRAFDEAAYGIARAGGDRGRAEAAGIGQPGRRSRSRWRWRWRCRTGVGAARRGGKRLHLRGELLDLRGERAHLRLETVDARVRCRAIAGRRGVAVCRLRDGGPAACQRLERADQDLHVDELLLELLDALLQRGVAAGSRSSCRGWSWGWRARSGLQPRPAPAGGSGCGVTCVNAGSASPSCGTGWAKPGSGEEVNCKQCRSQHGCDM